MVDDKKTGKNAKKSVAKKPKFKDLSDYSLEEPPENVDEEYYSDQFGGDYGGSSDEW
ncbi:MAG: hypothetical protein ABH834_05825 [Candidatus Altiarchaeota archaeon]